MHTFKEYLTEFLTDKQRSRFKSVKMTPEARESTDHFFGPGNDRVDEPLQMNGAEDKSEVHQKVEQHIGKDISPEEYKSGITTDKYGRQAKIGKMIKDKKLQSEFASDSTRAGSKKLTGARTVSIVRGTEVAGQTNSATDACHPRGHSWGNESCKNVDSGSNRKYLKPEIKHGSVVVRVHDHTGQEIYRATLQPHINDQGHRIYVRDSEYGIKDPAHTAHADDVAKRLSGEHRGGSVFYRLHPEVYDNTKGNETAIHPSMSMKDLSPETIDKEFNNDHNGTDLKAKLAKHSNISKRTLDTAIDHLSSEVRVGAASNPNLSSAQIDKLSKDSSSTVANTVIRHPKFTGEHLKTALEHPNAEVRQQAAANPNLNNDQIENLMKDKDMHVRQAIAIHPKLSEKHILGIQQQYNDPTHHMRRAVLNNPNIQKRHLDIAQKDPNEFVRAAVASHPLADKGHLDNALKDNSNEVVRSAITNPNISDHQLHDVANNHPVERMRKEALAEIQKRAGKSPH